MRTGDWRDASASELAARHAPASGLAGPVLVMEDPVPTFASALEEAGLEVHRYWRRAFDGRRASPWPSGGPYGTVAVRLPRAKEELRMLVHAAAGLMDAGGRLLLYGAKDEGAGSAGGRIEEVFQEVRTEATGRRCRLWSAQTPRRGMIRPVLDDWRVEFDPEVRELGTSWVSYPGVFAHGRLDGGTSLLLGVLPVPGDGRVLDFGCGHGVLGAAVATSSPGAQVSFLDVDAVALEAVKQNVQGARTLLGDGWSAVGEGSWDVVVSNPPWHTGKPETLQVVKDLVQGAACNLVAGGWLALVTQRRLSVGPLLAENFGEVKTMGDEGAWRAWHAVRR